ncbi:MAG: hypothetical protein KFW09_04965 [Oscillospiraceae bacterium]|nr:hypothetical protein [Oscillospiraceae bacterium]
MNKLTKKEKKHIEILINNELDYFFKESDEDNKDIIKLLMSINKKLNKTKKIKYKTKDITKKFLKGLKNE